MNPLGLMLIAIGLILIVIGFKGSQHNVLGAFKGTTSSAAAKKTGSTGNGLTS